MRFRNNTITLLLCVLLFSCRKQEIAVKPADRGDVNTISVDMGSDYKTQLFFSFSESGVVSSNLKTDWDLAFECGTSGFHVKTNTAKSMNVYNTGKSSFAAVPDTTGLGAGRKYDMPSGNPDSTAVGNWQANKFVYLVDRGFNAAGAHQGFTKVKFVSVDAGEYAVVVAGMQGTGETTVKIPKNKNKNFVYVSLSSNALVDIEPDKERYDLLFSQFTHIYSDPFQAYLVTGVLINPDKVRVSQVYDKAFADIEITDTVSHPLRSMQNSIGFDWKTYNFTTATYVVETVKSFIIRDTHGFFYKLHFIDFYGTSGVKGSPKMEYRKL